MLKSVFEPEGDLVVFRVYLALSGRIEEPEDAFDKAHQRLSRYLLCFSQHYLYIRLGSSPVRKSISRSHLDIRNISTLVESLEKVSWKYQFNWSSLLKLVNLLPDSFLHIFNPCLDTH